MSSISKGYTKIENNILEFLYSSNGLSPSELKVLLFLIRYTKGFNRDTVKASYSFIAKGVGCREETARKAIKKMIALELIKIEYPATGSAAQVVQILYKKWPRRNSANGLGEVGETAYPRLGEMAYQEIKEENKTIQIKTFKEKHPSFLVPGDDGWEDLPMQERIKIMEMLEEENGEQE